MPTPVGHSSAGLILFLLKNRVGEWPRLFQGWRQALGWILLANLPDIDLFNPYTRQWELESEFHHQEVHSIGFAIVVSGIAVFLAWLWRRRWNWKLGLWVFIAVSSHILLDYLFSNPAPGMPIFFPFSSVSFTSPIHMSYQLDEMDLFGTGNWIRLLCEGSISLVLISGVFGYFYYKNRSKR